MQSTIPPRLRALFDESTAAGTVLEFIECCDQILTDNKMPFFPAYTDHGTSHVGSVLEAAERLIDDAVWEGELLTPEDAVTLTAATFLHDLALHLQEPSFVALIAENSDQKPLPWFAEDQRGRSADLPWPELWQDFRRESRRFSQSHLDRILGPEHGEPRIAFEDLDAEPSSWRLSDRLIVGEFLRRHHARLAHEIAIYGFPGIAEKEFPALGKSLPALAEAIGAIARSHNEDMRTASDYLESRGKGDLRPDGVAQLYLMGVLRIADYFQVEDKRATPLLLHLREIQSPVSVREWEKHQAISSVSWDHKDPHAVSIQVSPTHNLRTHLQLAELLTDLQRELDITAAVLSETFGATKLSPLQLSLQRVRTNLHEPDLHRRLSFVPQRARTRSAEDLFRLVISDLYGNSPAVAGRELLQNAVDAVRELERWQAKQADGERLETRELPADVLVEVRGLDETFGQLRIIDRGIGMKPSTVIENFLTAGATSRRTREEDGPIDSQTAIKWMKAGRFGIGVFASFLLGPEVRVVTRHATEQRGISFSVRMDDELVQLNWADDVPVGTEITIKFSLADSATVSAKGSEPSKYRLLREISRFYGMPQPEVAYRAIDRKGKIEELGVSSEVPPPDHPLPDDWRSLSVPQFDSVLWQVPFVAAGRRGWKDTYNRVAHNGFFVEKVGSPLSRVYRWSRKPMKKLISPPTIAVFDTRHLLGVSLSRYELTERSLPFEDELLRSIGTDIVGHALTVGPAQFPLGIEWGLVPIVGKDRWLPFLPCLIHPYVDRDLCVLWIRNPEGETAGSFLSNELNSGSWSQLPFRAAFFPKNQGLRGSGFTAGEVQGAVDSMKALISREPVTSVLLRSLKTKPQATDLLRNAPDVALRDLLIAVGEELIDMEEVRDVALTVFRHTPETEETLISPIGEPWRNMIGGSLELSAEARRSRREEIARQHPPMGSLIEKWERLSQTREDA